MVASPDSAALAAGLPSVPPPLAELLADAVVVALPLRTRFRGLSEREALLLRGPAGWAEFSPFADYDDAVAARWLAAAIEYGWTPEAALPPSLRERIPVNAILPAVPPGEVAALLDRTPGVRTVKVKVAEPGGAPGEDEARVAAARAWLGPEGRLRVDANGAWSLEQAEQAVRRLAAYDLEYLEQPVAAAADLAALRARLAPLGPRIAADETLRLAVDPLAAAAGLAALADVAVLKAQPLGGIATALAVAGAAGLPAVVSSALESSVGLAMGARLAAALPELPFACGLGTGALLAADVVAWPLLPGADGAIPVRRVEPEPALLTRYAAAPERRAWWLARLERCHALLLRAQTA